MLLEFADGIKAQLADMDAKLDALGDAVGAMHADVRRLAGRPFMDVYKDWVLRCLKAATSQLPSAVYIECDVVGPGPKGNFEQHPKDNPPQKISQAFAEFMESDANVLLLSGAAGSGKSTAYDKLQLWVLTEYAPARLAKDGVAVVLLPVSLPQLKDAINGAYREGLDLAYDRTLRPSHADELRELVQNPNGKTEIVFFLDAYDGEVGE